jgi:hypothetical protein
MQSGVKWPPKPDLVKRLPPTPRCFYSAELAVSLGYIIRSYAFANVTNVPPSAGRRQYLLHRFIFSVLAPPAAHYGLVFLAFSGCYRVSPRSIVVVCSGPSLVAWREPI